MQLIWRQKEQFCKKIYNRQQLCDKVIASIRGEGRGFLPKELVPASESD